MRLFLFSTHFTTFRAFHRIDGGQLTVALPDCSSSVDWWSSTSLISPLQGLLLLHHLHNGEMREEGGSSIYFCVVMEVYFNDKLPRISNRPRFTSCPLINLPILLYSTEPLITSNMPEGTNKKPLRISIGEY